MQKQHESSYGIPAEKSEGSPGVGDKMIDSKLPGNFWKLSSGAKTKTASSLIPGHLLQNTKSTAMGALEMEKGSGLKTAELQVALFRMLKQKLVAAFYQSDQSAKAKTLAPLNQVTVAKQARSQQPTTVVHKSPPKGDVKQEASTKMTREIAEPTELKLIISQIMASRMLRKDSPPEPSPADEQTTEIPPTKRNCWQRLREKVCGKKSSQVQVANGENTTSSGTAAPGHKKQEKIINGQPESRYRVPEEKSSESHGVGDKKVDSKQPEALGSTIQDAKAKNGSTLIPSHILQNKQESSYRVPEEKSSGSHGVGDKKVDSKQPEALGSTIQDAKAKNGSSLIPDHILQHKQESSYRIPAEKSSGSNGVGDRKMDSKQPEALGISVQDAKTKPVSSLVPGHLLPNKQEISYASPGEKSKGSPGAGDRKMDSNLPETIGSYVQDAKAKTGSSLVPGHLFQNKQENSYASPAEKSKESPGSENRKKDSKLPETGSSVQDAKAKTGSSHIPGHLLQNNQENGYGSPGIGNKQVYSELPDASGSSHQDAKSKTVTSLKPELQNKKENSYGRPGVGEKKMDPKLPEDLRISDQNAKAKTVSTIKPDHLLQNKQGTSSPEQLVHNAPPRGDVKQEDINKNGKFKDPKPQKLTISGFEHSSEEQGKANLPARNEKQKDIVKHPSYKNVDNMTTKSIVAPTSSEQQKGFSNQENNYENQTNTRASSPMLTHFSSPGQGAQYLSKEQQKSYVASSGYPSKEQQK
ncbi:uncharacterized protein LOC116108294 [Pistacia vera]|uniref:uncharacterized protein LOC116108294 n=1 Tax=Pistacia vera TaxID=55513 RepID=UPI00126318A2|nr:uncharacterized protein LOC116108294 [Pistacia vera]